MAQTSDLPDLSDKDKLYPSHFVDPKIKAGKAWCNKYFRAFDYDYRSNGLTMFYNNRVEMMSLLNMIQGLEDPNYYKEQVDYTQTQDDDRSFMNIDYTPVNLGLKYLNVILGKLNSVDYSFQLNVMNNLAKKDEIEWVSKVKTFNALKDMYKSNGMDPAQEIVGEPEEDIPTDDSEIDYLKNTSKRSKTAIYKKMMIDHNMAMNDMKSILHECDFDTFLYGYTGIHNYLDGNGVLRSERADSFNIAVGYSNKENFSDVDKIGLYSFKTISDIRTADQSIPEATLKMLAEKYQSMYGNVAFQYMTGIDQSLVNYPYDTCRVPCFTGYTFSYDPEHIEVRKQSSGKTITKPVKFEDYAAKKEIVPPVGSDYKSEVKVKGRVNIYKGTVVLGSEDVCFSYGLCNNVPRKYYWQKPPLPIMLSAPNIKKGKAISTFKQITPPLRKIGVYGAKIQQMVAAAIPKGIGINQDALAETILESGGIVNSPQEAINMFVARGIFVYSNKDSEGNPMQGFPFQELANGLSADFMSLYSAINFEKQNIQDILGENPITDSSNPGSETGLGIANLAVQGNNNALNYLFNGKLNLFKRTIEIYSEYIDMMLLFADKDMLIHAYGKNIVDELTDTVNMGLSDWTIDVSIKPSAQEFARIYNTVENMVNAGLLDPEDVFTIYKMDDLNMIGEYCKTKAAISRKRAAQSKQQDIAANAKVQQDSAAQAFQQAMQLELAKQEKKNEAKFAELESNLKETGMKLAQAQTIAQNNNDTVLKKQEISDMAEMRRMILEIHGKMEADMEVQAQQHEHEKSMPKPTTA